MMKKNPFDLPDAEIQTNWAKSSNRAVSVDNMVKRMKMGFSRYAEQDMRLNLSRHLALRILVTIPGTKRQLASQFSGVEIEIHLPPCPVAQATIIHETPMAQAVFPKPQYHIDATAGRWFTIRPKTRKNSVQVVRSQKPRMMD